MVGSTFQGICKENSIDFIPGIAEAVAKAKNSGVIVDGLPYDSHWNSKGHSIAGNIILAYLDERGYLHKRDRSTAGSLPAYRNLLRKYRAVSDNIISVEKFSLDSLTSRNSDGFGHVEGPCPQWNMPSQGSVDDIP